MLRKSTKRRIMLESDDEEMGGLYTDKEDKERLSKLSELERECILEERLQKRQEAIDKMNLRKLLQEQQGPNAGLELDEYANSATPHSLEDVHQEHAGTDSDGECEENIDSSTDVEGPVAIKVEQFATLGDFEHVVVTRKTIRSNMFAPWFSEYIKGAWVKYLYEKDCYRLCNVEDLSLAKPYEIDGGIFDQQAHLIYGGLRFRVNLDRISNLPLTQNDYYDMLQACMRDESPLPTKSSLHAKGAQMKRLRERMMTEPDVNQMLNRFLMLNPKPVTAKDRVLQDLNLRRNLPPQVGTSTVGTSTTTQLAHNEVELTDQKLKREQAPQIEGNVYEWLDVDLGDF